MNPEIKAKWIKALRSGKYKQAQRRLKTDDGYCCLGVLCETLGMKPLKDDGYWLYDKETDVLPSSAMRAAGIRSTNCKLPRPVNFEEKAAKFISELNDCGADFNFIADVIEKQL